MAKNKKVKASDLRKKSYRRNQKKEINWGTIGIVTAIFFFGLFVGMVIGIEQGQMMLFEGAAIALQGSNIDVNIDLNETELVNRINETIIPAMKYIFQEGLE